MKKYLLASLSALIFIGCASISPTAYVDKLLERGEFAELYYYVVIVGDKNVDQPKFKNAIISATGGAANDKFFNLAIKQINILHHPHADFFVDNHKFIQEARKDGLVTEVQERQLSEALQAHLEKDLMAKPGLANSAALGNLYPNIKAKKDELFQETLRALTLEPNSSINSFFPLYDYFSSSNNEAGKMQALMAMKNRAEKTISASKMLSDINPVFEYIKAIGDRSLDAKVVSSLKGMGLKRSEINGSVKELFPEFYKEYIAELKSKKNTNLSRGGGISSVLIEACNGIKEDAKRLSCLQEVMSNKSQNVAQADNGVQDLKKSFASISGAVNSGINFQKYQAIALEPAKALSVLTAINKDVEPDVIGYLTKSAEAYKDAETLWRAHIYNSQDGGIVFGRILNYRMIGLDWLVNKYHLPTNVVLFNENVPLNPSLSIIWRVASENSAKAMELLDE